MTESDSILQIHPVSLHFLSSCCICRPKESRFLNLFLSIMLDLCQISETLKKLSRSPYLSPLILSSSFAVAVSYLDIVRCGNLSPFKLGNNQWTHFKIPRGFTKSDPLTFTQSQISGRSCTFARMLFACSKSCYYRWRGTTLFQIKRPTSR